MGLLVQSNAIAQTAADDTIPTLAGKESRHDNRVET
jgi:hypothetical protein